MGEALDGPAGGEAAFGARLRRARLAAGLTQEELAERAGLSARGIQDLERGLRATPQRETVRRLAGALGLPPGDAAALGATVSRARRPGSGAAGLGPEPAAGADRPEAVRGQWPRPLTSFVGRERELAAVRARLRDPGVRLLTLTGPGGVGKTRLALRAAADALEADGTPYPDGRWLVELEALADPALVPQTVAAAVGVREDPGHPLLATLTDALRPKRLLLVLDNCEHLLDACARLADTLLRICPGLTVLATSREVLGVAGEVPYRVPPLALPELPAPPDAPRPTLPGELARAEAVRLFVERAATVQPAFAVTAQNARPLAAICRRLDGLPLALELAAARVRVLGIEELLARLEDRFRLLTGGARTAAARHRTLRAAVDWSYDLLTAQEQALFARVAVFAGGFTLEAAEAVGPGEGIGAPDVLDLLTRLVDQSLVTVDAPSDGTVRYRLLETLRTYARHHLAAGGGEAAVRARHAAYYLALAQTGALALRGAAQLAWLDRLEREHNNLRAALEWLEQQGRLEPALLLGGALWRFWMLRGHVSEGRARLTGPLDRAAGVAAGAARVDPAVHADALFGAGALAELQGDLGAAWALQERSLPLWREAQDESGVGYARYLLGNIAYDRGDLAAARPLLEAGLAAQRATGDRRGIAWTAGALGRTLAAVGEYAAARPLIEERLAICREDGDRLGVSLALWFLANLAFDEGRPGEAAALRREALALGRELDDRNYVAPQLEGFGEAAAADGDPQRALRLAGAAAALRAAAGTPPTTPEQARLDRWLAPVGVAVGDDVRSRAWAEGQGMTRETAVAYALEETPDADLA